MKTAERNGAAWARDHRRLWREVTAAAERHEMSPIGLLQSMVAWELGAIQCLTCREEALRWTDRAIRSMAAKYPLVSDCADECRHGRGLDA